MKRENLVVVGQGYVGLPLAVEAAEAGYCVTGLETNLAVCDGLNTGRSHVDDVSDEVIIRLLDRGYHATMDQACLSAADVAVICVPTPLDDSGGPDLRAVESATRAIAAHIHPGMTIILESTTYPGTTEDYVLPLLEESGLRHGTDFLLAFSPERVDPGNPAFGVRNTPKLVGGVSPAATNAAAAFYADFVETVVPMSGAKEAETAKLLENTYRHINIALVNEMAKFCHELNIDIWEVIRGASSKPFGFQAFKPGPGVGGHCIPIDPNYLSYQVRKVLGYRFRFVELAQEINNSMPGYVVQRVQDLLNESSKPLRGSRVLLLGITYKPDIADQRETPALPLARILRDKGAVVSYHDPYVDSWWVGNAAIERIYDLDLAVSSSDVVVLLQDHAVYAADNLAGKAAAFFDTRGVTQTQDATRL